MNAISPVDYSVISQALMSTAREMGVKLTRSAFSNAVRDVKDASTGILNARGDSVAQSDELIPILVGSLSMAFKYCAASCPVGNLIEGDFYITNDPYHGCHHLNDIFVFMPIFVDAELMGFAAAVAHHVDIGGSGPLDWKTKELFQEGLIIPPMRCNIRDWQGGTLERLFTANVRMPEHAIGDLNAQFVAGGTGVTRMRELCAKFGKDTVRQAMEQMLDYSERRVRAAISAIPDGVYRAEHTVDHDGATEWPLTVHAEVTIAGDLLDVSFEGTAEQSKLSSNAPFASTVAAALTAVKMIVTDMDVPYNDGAFRAITIRAPLGCLVNPRRPAAVVHRMEVIYRAFDSVAQALGQAVPDRAMACGYDTTYGIMLSRMDGGKYHVYVEPHGQGVGASSRNDGADGVAGPLSNCANVPVEMIDLGYDFFRIERYEIIPGSGGAGRFRGGDGLRRTYRILKDNVNGVIIADRFESPAPGLAGGESGVPGSCELIRDNGDRVQYGSLDAVVLHTNDVLMASTGGGGGYGPRS